MAVGSITHRTGISVGAISGILGSANDVEPSAHHHIRRIVRGLKCAIGVSTHTVQSNNAGLVKLGVFSFSRPFIPFFASGIVRCTGRHRCNMIVGACNSSNRKLITDISRSCHLKTRK